MNNSLKLLAAGLFGLCWCPVLYASGSAEVDSDALSLEAAPSDTVKASNSTTKAFVEAAFGNASQRYLPASQSTRRATFDYSLNLKVGDQFRFALSDRIDHVHPLPASGDSTINSLKEAYLTWQSSEGGLIVEAGRINLKYGVAYGYNPTDFFRDGSLRTLTTANPFALRDNRLGTGMVRAQMLWQGGSASIAYSPKLASRPSLSGWSLDFGSTNNRDRLLVNLGTQFSQALSTQLMFYKSSGDSPMLGASLTGLISDAATVAVEWTHGREESLVSRSLGLSLAKENRNRVAAGITYTTLGKLSLTAEYQYNGFALSKTNWAALSQNSPVGQVAYLVEAQRLQELSSRSAILLYVTQKDLFIKDLDLTAFVRFNLLDDSKMTWIELRRHWAKFDLALQLQNHIGRPGSEFGILPDRRVLQVLGTYYF
jgi:hypothetical protein